MLKVSAMNIHFQQQEKTGHYGIKMPGGGIYIICDRIRSKVITERLCTESVFNYIQRASKIFCTPGGMPFNSIMLRAYIRRNEGNETEADLEQYEEISSQKSCTNIQYSIAVTEVI